MRNQNEGLQAGVHIDKAIKYYEKALSDSSQPSPRLLYEYFEAQDFKAQYLSLSIHDKKTLYQKLIKLLERFYPYYSDTPELNYCLAVAWGRYGELIGVLQAARSGIADKILRYATKLYRKDKDFRNGVAGVILGRLHYKTPKIPLLLSWPSLAKSETYLLEVVQRHPNYLRAKLYLADTLLKKGDKPSYRRAVQIYRSIVSRPPTPSQYLEERAVIEEAQKRLANIGSD